MRMSKYFFVGIKGAGMGALANVLKCQGHDVSGSDTTSYVFTEAALKANGINIVPFSEENFVQDYDVIIRGNSFTSENNLEIAYLEKHNIPYVSYYDFLRDFANEYLSIGVSGAHGKTTTTGLLVKMFEKAEVAYLIGDGTGFATEYSKYFIFEACEYKRHFLSYYPDYLIITNIDFDHPDYFTDVDDIIAAFSQAAKQTKKAVVAYGDDINVQKLISQKINTPIITYGFDEHNDYQIINFEPISTGMQFDLKYGENLATFNLPFFGEHMLLNAVSVIIISQNVGKSIETMGAKLAEFTGVKRRFNVITTKEAILVDDYAHHPTEIKATINAARHKFADKKIVAVFQPHTFSRTESLAQEFALELMKADFVYVTNIFASAREQGKCVYPQTILEKLPHAEHLDFSNITKLLTHDDAVILFMGAGDIQEYLALTKKIIEKH